MKDYHEMAKSVLSRRDTYVAARRTRHKRLTATLAGFCLCAIVGTGVLYSDTLFGTQPIFAPPGETCGTGRADSRDVGQTDTPAPVVIGDGDTAPTPPPVTLVINEIASDEVTGIFANTAFLNLRMEDFHKMSRAQMLDYLGVSLDLSADFPAFAEASNAVYGYYEFRDGFVWAQQDFHYYAEDGRAFHIVMRKGGMPFSCFVTAYAAQAERSDIMGYSILAAHYFVNGVDTYYAEFQKENVGITVTAENLTADEFTELVTVLVQ